MELSLISCSITRLNLSSMGLPAATVYLLVAFNWAFFYTGLSLSFKKNIVQLGKMQKTTTKIIKGCSA